MQRRGSTGNTTASRVKALLLHVQASHGRAEADAFLRETRLDRDYLDDETRPLPIEVWHAALVAFASRFGRAAIADAVPGFVHAENLGVWTRVLRGADSPETAYRQLDNHGGDDALTDRWHTVSAGAGAWRGRIPLRHDPAHERDGLCQLARTAELAAVPLLFGLAPAAVEVAPGDAERSGGAVQEYVARWSARRGGAAPAIGATTGVLASAGTAFWLHAAAAAAVVTGAGVAGAAVGAATEVERRRRVQSRAQLIRIQVLERSAALREARERGAAGFREGVVIAGQYRLGEKLGTGASGAIWEAMRLADGEVVAIKLLRTAVAHDTIAADRLRREAAALGLAWHPNVVEVYDDGHLPDGTSYLVMERLYGESLAARVRRAGALSPDELLPLALQVCDALGAVHAAGIVHRDLKPSNIFLARGRGSEGPSSRPPVVKLLDFGIARVEWAETRLTNMGAPVGTPGYMSPEQEQGLEIDGRADIFALGGVLYECLSGQPPPVRSDELWEPPPRAGESTSGVQRALSTIPDAWRKVIERALSRAARQRYPDAKAAREALAALAPPIVRVDSAS